MGLPKIALPEYSLKLPSTGEEIKYRPFLVKEEKILLLAMESEDTKQIMTATKNVIQSCVYNDLEIDGLPMFDIEYIFLWLRARAKGEKIELNYKCPKCEGAIPLSFNIEDVKIHRNDKHEQKIQVNEELGVMMKYPNMALQVLLESSQEKNQIEQLFMTIRLCIDYIYDNEKMYSSKDHTEQELVDFLESLSDNQFQKLSKFFETMPKLQHEIELNCLNNKSDKNKKKVVCGYKEPLVLEGLQSFFD